MTEKDITICGHGSGNPSLKNMYSYLENRYQQIASNGKHKCLVSVKRLRALTDEKRVQFAATYKTILGRNIYNQDLRQYVYTPYKGVYYSDCSSSGCATFKQIGYPVSLLNTAGIYNSKLFVDVPVTIENGHVTNPEILKVGDCLLFVGNDPSRPLQIGHIEYVYEIPEEKEIEVTPVEGTLGVTSETLNIRNSPVNGQIVGTYKQKDQIKVTGKYGKWFQTDLGWVSGLYLGGWIKQSGKWWYLTDNYNYYAKTVATINGKDYAFDKDGWMIESEKIASTGEIIYE